MEWLAMAIASFSTLVLGFIWYNPKLFGNAWMESVGMTEEDASKASMPLILGLSFILGAVIAYRLNMGAGYHPEEDQNFLHGAFHAAQTAGFYAIPVLIINFLNEQRSLKGILINAVYWLIAFALMGGILYAWKGAGL
ncbi:MAG: DUF1761 domain-containing protein [Chitinophagales bacterium]|nr:DUF1761 domain-containing protein [Chitinophagales bacterium]